MYNEVQGKWISQNFNTDKIHAFILIMENNGVIKDIRIYCTVDWKNVLRLSINVI